MTEYLTAWGVAFYGGRPSKKSPFSLDFLVRCHGCLLLCWLILRCLLKFLQYFLFLSPSVDFCVV